MQKVLGVLVLVAVVTLAVTGPAGAVTPQANGLPFDNMGQSAVSSARQVWIPAIVVLGLIGLAVAFIIGVRMLAGMSVRTAIALGILGIAATGVGLGTLFPGIVTAGIVP